MKYVREFDYFPSSLIKDLCFENEGSQKKFDGLFSQEPSKWLGLAFTGTVHADSFEPDKTEIDKNEVENFISALENADNDLFARLARDLAYNIEETIFSCLMGIVFDASFLNALDAPFGVLCFENSDDAEDSDVCVTDDLCCYFETHFEKMGIEKIIEVLKTLIN